MGRGTLRQFREVLRLVPTIDEIRQVLTRLGWPHAPSQQLLSDGERVAYMIRYSQIMNRRGFVIGGGFSINYVVLPDIGEPPRFTFDIDTAPPTPASKLSVLEMVAEANRELVEEGHAVAVWAGRHVYFGLLEHDVEKDVFPYLLPLRVPVVARWSGVPLWAYLRRMGVEVGYDVIAEVKRISAEVLGVDTPRVDFLRIGVSVELNPPVELYGGFKISSVAWQLAEKARRKIVDPLRRGYVDHDVLKALLDLRAVWAVPRSSLARYFDEGLRAELVELLPQAAERTDIYWQSHHYALVKGKYSSPREVAERILDFLRRI
ncbi:MAG: hypothetical protein ACPL3C_02465 [Pyrobaculum sp.]